MARPSPQNMNRVWNPTHGIVFGNGTPLAMIPSRGAGRNITSNSIDSDIARQSNIEDSYVLAGSFEDEIPPSQTSTNASIIGNEDAESTASWVPSSEAASQASVREEVLSEEEMMQEEDNEGAIASEKEMHEALAFQIPKEVLRKAKEAPPGTKESYWSHKLYVGPEEKDVVVHYCKSKHTTERVAKYFANDSVIGFDIEWKPEATRNSGIKRNVALIQIANQERIGLFHISMFPGDTVDALVAPTLKAIMEDPKVTKLGVAIKADCTRLRNFLQIDSKGVFELSHLYKLVKYSTSGNVSMINKKLVSLATQVEEHLPLPIFKGDVRGSDWSLGPLSIDQIIYAASDAYCNFMLNDALEAKRKLLDPCPPRPYHAELNLPIRLATGTEIPTADEATEEPDAAPSSTSRLNTSNPLLESHPASASEAAAENVQIESEDDTDLSYVLPPASKPKEKITKEASPLQPPKSALIIAAESWAVSHRAAHPILRPSDPPSTSSTSSSRSALPAPALAGLRAYALWHFNPDMSLQEVAAELRQPPLRISTVANYVLEVVRVEGVEFDRSRLREVFRAWPGGVGGGAWRYRGLRGRVGLDGGTGKE